MRPSTIGETVHRSESAPVRNCYAVEYCWHPNAHVLQETCGSVAEPCDVGACQHQRTKSVRLAWGAISPCTLKVCHSVYLLDLCFMKLQSTVHISRDNKRCYTKRPHPPPTSNHASPCCRLPVPPRRRDKRAAATTADRAHRDAFFPLLQGQSLLRLPPVA